VVWIGYDNSGCSHVNLGDLMQTNTLKRIFPLGLMVIGVALLSAGVAYAWVNQRITNPSPAPLPANVVNLDLVNHSSGQRASSEVSRLHDQDFPFTSASVGRYGPDHSITVWVTGVPFRMMAGRMVVAMRDKIDEVETPFTPINQRQDGRRTVYELVGLGQRHFYFQSANLIVWLGVDEHLADQALTELLEFYP
jgi:hypothetical protein